MQLPTNKSILWLVVVTCLLCSLVTASAQTNPPNTSAKPPLKSTNPMDAQKGSASDDGPPLTTFEEEMRAKRMIKLAEKEHQQNIERAREISQIAKDLGQNFKSLDRDSLKRLDRLEKLTKKIRGEAGGEANEVQIVDSPANQSSAVTQIAEKAEALSKAVQNTPRQVVSAGVIDSANVLLELIRILRTFSQ